MKRYAVIGNPIGHSLSPAMHNAAFKEMGVDAKYEALEVERLDRAWGHLKSTYSGINVTIPHKVAIMDYIDEKEMAVDLIGAVNCVGFNSVVRGYNTDLYGAVEALKTEVPKLKNKRVLVLGAGGAARAIVYGCLLEGMKVSVYNRTVEKADELAAEIKEKLSKDIAVAPGPYLDKTDVVINATSVGMTPKADTTPLTSPIPSNVVVMDIVYNPLETRLLKQAKAAGARTVGGVEMFVRQGAESLRIWGYEPPVDAMREAVLKALKK
jgi:shikimate dehydrogenase